LGNWGRLLASRCQVRNKVQSYFPGATLTLWSKPDYDPPSSPIALPHETDLMGLFVVILLIDGDGVRPDDPRLLGITEMAQCRFEALWNIKICVVADDGSW